MTLMQSRGQPVTLAEVVPPAGIKYVLSESLSPSTSTRTAPLAGFSPSNGLAARICRRPQSAPAIADRLAPRDLGNRVR